MKYCWISGAILSNKYLKYPKTGKFNMVCWFVSCCSSIISIRNKMKLRKYALKIDVYDHATIKEREAKKGKNFVLIY
jgi:hypothetical protein